MSKNKVVVFDSYGVARVFVTEDISNISQGPGEKVFINPDLSFVANHPPELWTLDSNNTIFPLEDALVEQRLNDLKSRNHIKLADFDLRDNVQILRQMAEVIAGELQKQTQAVEAASLKTSSEVYGYLNALKDSVEHSMGAASKDLDLTERHLMSKANLIIDKQNDLKSQTEDSRASLSSALNKESIMTRNLIEGALAQLLKNQDWIKETRKDAELHFNHLVERQDKLSGCMFRMFCLLLGIYLFYLAIALSMKI